MVSAMTRSPCRTTRCLLVCRMRLADRESGLSARTIARRLSPVSGFYAYLIARGDTPVRVNPVPRLLEVNGDLPPIELEHAHYRQTTGLTEAG